MKPWKRFVFVFIAYGLALFHTIVPHQHTQQDEGKTTIFHAGCIVDDSMGGFLQMIFSTDLGYGHLETFQKGGGADINVSFDAVFTIVFLFAIPFSFTPLPVIREFLRAYIEKLQKRLLLFSSNHFRSPPALI